MSTRNHIPCTVNGVLDARLAPFQLHEPRPLLEDLDVDLSQNVAPHRERPFHRALINDLKLLFAALGAGGSAVPLGDNGRTARLLSNYAASLRDH
jgi:hypothetical protein